LTTFIVAATKLDGDAMMVAFLAGEIAVSQAIPMGHLRLCVVIEIALGLIVFTTYFNNRLPVDALGVLLGLVALLPLAIGDGIQIYKEGT
jgi:hypothetical protein